METRHCVSLRHTMRGFDTRVYCEVIPRIRLVSTSLSSQKYIVCVCVCVCVW